MQTTHNVVLHVHIANRSTKHYLTVSLTAAGDTTTLLTSLGAHLDMHEWSNLRSPVMDDKNRGRSVIFPGQVSVFNSLHCFNTVGWVTWRKRSLRCPCHIPKCSIIQQGKEEKPGKLDNQKLPKIGHYNSDDCIGALSAFLLRLRFSFG